MSMHVDIYSLQLKRKLSLQKNTEPSVEGNFLKMLFKESLVRVIWNFDNKQLGIKWFITKIYYEQRVWNILLAVQFLQEDKSLLITLNWNPR